VRPHQAQDRQVQIPTIGVMVVSHLCYFHLATASCAAEVDDAMAPVSQS
jgi:hypothetical protein